MDTGDHSRDLRDPITVYGVAKSRTFRAIWVLEEIGIPWRHVDVGFDGSENSVSATWFGELNPNRRVPVIVDGGFHLWESFAITLYLAKRYSRKLYPQHIELEAEVWKWTLWASVELEAPLFSYVKARFINPSKQINAADSESLFKKITCLMSVLDTALQKTDFLLGKEFSIADLNVSSVFYSAYFYKLSIEFPILQNWLVSCLERPAALRARALRE